MLIQLVTIAVNGVQGLSAELFEPIFRELREVCLYTFRDEASIPCELSTGPVIYVATSGGGGGGGGAAGEDEGLDPTIIAGVAVLGLGVVGLVVYVAFSSGLMGGTTATTEVTRMPAAINPPANAYQPQGGGDKDRFVSLS